MAEETDLVKHYTDGQSVEELALKYPGSAESHIMLHRKLDAIGVLLADLLRRLGSTSLGSTPR